jgi:hypothetical protein
MKRRPRLVALVVVALGVAVVVAAQSIAGLTAYPPPSTESTKGVFIVRCLFSHQKQVDPIVAPGRVSAHLHDFFGNRSTDSTSTYDSMVASGTTCGLRADTGAYWIQSLYTPSGALVKPVAAFAYYRNKPVKYGTTMPFPKDFRLIAGGVGSSNAGWSCEQDAASMTATPPDCGSKKLVAHVRFPNCWNGALDSPDHRSHVVYPAGTGSTACPSTHPIKLPEIFLHVRYPSGVKAGSMSDGTLAPHADFWNTWQQTKLEQVVHDCLQLGKSCGTLTG